MPTVSYTLPWRNEEKKTFETLFSQPWWLIRDINWHLSLLGLTTSVISSELLFVPVIWPSATANETHVGQSRHVVPCELCNVCMCCHLRRYFTVCQTFIKLQKNKRNRVEIKPVIVHCCRKTACMTVLMLCKKIKNKGNQRNFYCEETALPVAPLCRPIYKLLQVKNNLDGWLDRWNDRMTDRRMDGWMDG